MKNLYFIISICNLRLKLVLIVGVLICSQGNLFAQLGFCQGNTGDPIFEEDFGQGTQNGPALSSDITSYEYVDTNVEDGQYTISSTTFHLGAFHNTTDNTGNENGRALIVNADFDPGLFYEIPIEGLCINTSYEFSAFLLNLYNASTGVCAGNEIPVNVRFQIWDETDTQLLAEGDTGDIFGTSTPIWNQYALTFSTLPGQTSVILKMLNNAGGGCGNDLAIDDIVFRSCGDTTEIISETNETSFQFCEGEQLTDVVLEAVPDFSTYNSHNYQWQESFDGENWVDIPDETDNQIIISSVSESKFYRTLVAEDPNNVNNTSCNSISNNFEFEQIDLIAPISLGDVFVCENENEILAVEANANIRINWYDSAEGGALLAENTYEFQPDENGIYYAEAVTNVGNCTPPNRTEIFYEQYNVPELQDEVIQSCEGETLILSEPIENVDFFWSTGENSSSIEVTEAGVYELEVITQDNCIVSKTFTIETFTPPVISNVSQNENTLRIEMESTGEFMFSIDDINYQNQPEFDVFEGGLYTVYVRENNGCGIVTTEFLFFKVPDFFTPNGDQINDTFRINDDVLFENFEVAIYDRYGKLLARSLEAPFEWDGTYNGKPMPEDDYWYKIRVDGKTYTGNVTLIR